MHHPLIIDCDTGRDDALAIWMALGLNAPLKALVSSYGNIVRDQVSENCLRVLAFAGRDDIAVLPGASAPSRAHAAIESTLTPRQKAAGNGLCNLELPRAARPVPAPAALAAEILAIADQYGPLDYVVTGPATNLGSIIDEVSDSIARITMMGGKMNALWDTMPGADFNLLCDPFAVDAVLKSGLPVRFVPMDTTWPMVLDIPQLQALKPKTKLAAFAKDLMIAHATHFAAEPVFRFHDPAVIALLDDKNFAPVKLRIVTDEKDFGRLIEDDRGYPAFLHRADDALRTRTLAVMLARLGFEDRV